MKLIDSIRYDSAQKREHAHAYSTRRRSESFHDIQAAGRALPNIRKDKWWGREERSFAQKGLSKLEEKSSNAADPSFKKSSISGMGLSRPKKSRFKTVFDREEELDDEEAPGGFRRPEEAFEMARNDLRSKEWQTEIDGLEALLRLVRFHSDLVERDLHVIVADVTHECKNLRSQVTRAAIQTAALMVAHLDVAADVRGVKELAQVGSVNLCSGLGQHAKSSNS